MRDVTAIRTQFQALMDASIKQVIPYKHPWRSRKATRTWMSREYDHAIQYFMAAYGLTRTRTIQIVGLRKDWLDGAKEQWS